MLDDVQTRARRHHHIDEGHVRPEAVREPDRLSDGTRFFEHIVANQRDAHQFTKSRLILTNQDTRARPPLSHTTSLNTSSSLEGFCLSEVTVNVPRTLLYKPVPPTTASS